MGYYIGVDGGGTKTAFALFDENKECLAVVTGPGSNHENMSGSFKEASQIIANGISELLEKQNLTINEIDYMLMGLAGIDHQFQHDAMAEEFKALGYKNFSIYNDGFIVIKAGATNSAAIGYNCGTGTCCNCIDSEGKMMQLAGLGDFSGDKGNGTWLSTNAYRIIYDDVFLGLEKTLLTDLYYTEFGINSRDEFLASVSEFEGDEAIPHIMKVNKLLFEAAERGDKPALSIIEEMAQRGADLISALVREMKFDTPTIEVVLSGSIHTKADSKIYLDALEKKTVEKCGRPLKFIKLEHPPVVGCVNWIFEILGK